MSTFTMVDCTAYFAGHDMTTDANKLTVKVEVEDKEKTTFGTGGWKSRAGGLKDFSAELEGYWQAGTGQIDDEAFSKLGTTGEPFSATPTGAVNDVAYFGQAGEFSYELLGQVGDMTPFTLGLQGSERAGIVRGRLAKAKSTVSGTGATGSSVNLGPISAGQRVYAVVHVFSAGTSLTLKIERSASADFSGPSDVVTLDPITESGAVWVAVDSAASSDAYYRFNVTAVSGTFTVAGAIGIAS